MNETKTEWRDCADPDELAAAVAAGVEVRWAKPGWSSGEWALSTSSSPANFAGAMRRGNRYSVPTSWTWSPEPPASEGVRRVWTCKVGGNVTSLPGGADAPMRRAVATAFTELTGHPVEFCFSGWGDDLDEAELAVVEDRAPDAEVIRAALVKRLAALPDPSPGVTSMACDHPNPCTPEPPAPDDLVSRARRHADTHPESRDLIEVADLDGGRQVCTAPTPPPVPPNPMAVREFAAKVADYVSTHQNADGMSKRGWAIEAVVQALEEPTASQEARSILAPTPPWPGAVLSGLTDEDGVPTWLAQAGQVRGEQVRACTSVPWLPNTSYGEDEWVEVRAPRAMPEPETERVPVWEAVDRWMPGGRVICGWQWSTQTRDGSVTHDDGTFTPVHDAPTVEVLKDGNP